MSCGVYAIINRHNNKLYIGSSMNIERRWKDHLRLLSRNKHHNYYLQSIYNKNGEGGFEFKIIETCKKDCLKEREQYFMYRYNSTNSECGYNISLDTTVPMRDLSEEGRKLFSKAHLKYSHLVNEWKELFKQGCSCREFDEAMKILVSN